MKIKKFLALALVFALVLTLFVGCANDTQTSSNTQTDPNASSTESSSQTSDSSKTAYVPDNKSLTVGVSADPKSFALWGDFNAGRQSLMPMVYQALTYYVPDTVNGTTTEYFVLASGYEKVADNTYEVTIREGIHDTAGNPFTASDAVYSFETANKNGTWAELNAVDGFEVVDDYKFRIYTNDNLMVGDFQNILTNFPMITKASFEASSDEMVTTPVGTTGYVLSEYVPGGYAVFEKADSYWNDDANESKSIVDGYCPWFDCTKLDTVRFEFITDTSAMTVALESGAIDISANISVSDSEVFQNGNNAGKFTIGTRPGNMYALSFNAAETSPTNNYNLRMALAYAVDAQGVLDAAFDGSGVVLKAWSFPTYSDWQDSWDTDDYFEYDLNLAKEYLKKFYDETGTTANTLNLRLLNQSGSATGKIAEAIQAYIVALVGNSTCVEILSYDRGVYESMYEDSDAFDLLLMYSQTVTRTTSAYAWSRQANASKTLSGNDLWHSGDQKGQELLFAAVGYDTYSDATISAFQAYINEQAYMKSLICGDIYVVAAGWISGLENCIGYKDALAVLALDYDWSLSGK